MHAHEAGDACTQKDKKRDSAEPKEPLDPALVPANIVSPCSMRLSGHSILRSRAYCTW